MKSMLTKLLATIAIVGGLTSCTTTTTVGGSYYDCYWEYEYDYYYGVWYEYEVCGWYYYNQDGAKEFELDLVADVADTEAFALQKTADLYAEKFALSNDQALKIAKNIKDFEALEDRSNDDLADFAQKLYGVNPSEVIDAVSAAQVGNNADLESVIEKAAKNFNTSNDTMKAIVKELHGHALQSNGIDL
jgi:hypothetical protein